MRPSRARPAARPSERRGARRANQPLVIGWREYVAFPEWGIAGVLTKIDTGARTSSLHVADVEELADGRLRFDVVLSRKPHDRQVRVEARPVRTAKIRPTTGLAESRRVVAVKVRIGPVEKTIEVSLVSRQHMLCRMLLGRTALCGTFLVDPDRVYVFGRPGRSSGEVAP
ncbi:MAG: ATP-dependent zinc protease [Planctomycetes bacterium]|nr:ATP-dependent zinc protease [Planctomycetota bacterium]